MAWYVMSFSTFVSIDIEGKERSFGLTKLREINKFYSPIFFLKEFLGTAFIFDS